VKGLSIVVLIGLVLAGFAPWPAHGQDEEWSVFFTNSSGDRFYYNSQSIVYDRDKSVKVLQRVVPGQQNSNILELRMEMEFKCKELMYRQLRAETISRDGTTRERSGPGQWDPITPGSVTDALSKKACSKVKIRDRGDR